MPCSCCVVYYTSGYKSNTDKPPKYGNCTILDKHAPKISVSEIKDIFQGDEENVRTNKLNDVQSKIDMLVEDG
ncbi:Uncharacterized protein FWK35_00033234 [Aphis craccivora]|uniref:Uncharacterized protein n=1 Tax=Aphis craccivora TaxID=307492 RepID=A0A6G0VTT0_APHCR|nr:Uncharacterized protein FWK35_00033234 [Aphis craccivora]